jgi:hypothetical protein
MKKIFRFSLFIYLLLIPFVGYSQYWSKRFDIENGNDRGSTVTVVNDGFIVNSINLCKLNTTVCGGVVKLDFEGNVVWKSIYYDSIRTNGVESLQIRNDTIYIFANYHEIPYKYYTILAYDLEGNYLSKYDFPSKGEKNWARNMSIKGNNAFVTFNYIDSTNTQIKNIIKFNQDWSIAWHINYAVGVSAPVLTQRVQSTPDSGCIIIYTYGHNWDLKLGIEKFDKMGNLEWRKGIDKEEYSSFKISLVPTHEGGYYGLWKKDTLMVSVFHYNEPPIVFRLDSQGNFLWQKIYIGIAPFVAYTMFTTQNNDFVVVGDGFNNGYDSTIIDVKYGYAGFIRRYNPEGELVFSRRISDYTKGGESCGFVSGTELPNQDLAFVGYIEDTLPNDPYPREVWLVKTDANGCIAPDCGLNQTFLDTELPPSIEKPEQQNAFVIYPVPFNDKITIGSILGIHLPKGKYQFELYDMLGQSVFKDSFNPNLMSDFSMPKSLPSGSYLATIKLDGIVKQQQIIVRH